MKRAHTEAEKLAELTHEQLWQVCQRQPDDYEPYGKRTRLTDIRCWSERTSSHSSVHI
jgi:hypothetical protein